jgi:hypothetical protein
MAMEKRDVAASIAEPMVSACSKQSQLCCNRLDGQLSVGNTIIGRAAGAPFQEMRALDEHLAPRRRAGAVVVATCYASQVLMGVSKWLNVRNSRTS